MTQNQIVSKHVFVPNISRPRCTPPQPTTVDQLEDNISSEVAALDTDMVWEAAWCVRGTAARCINNGGGFFEK